MHLPLLTHGHLIIYHLLLTLVMDPVAGHAYVQEGDIRDSRIDVRVGRSGKKKPAILRLALEYRRHSIAGHMGIDQSPPRGNSIPPD